MNLNQVTVPALDVPKSIAFYEMLGLKLIVHTHHRYARFECPDGDATFSIHQVDAQKEGASIQVYFECDDLDDRVEKLREAGIHFDEWPTNQPWLWREAHLKDPFGNQIILYHAAENRKNPPWRLG